MTTKTAIPTHAPFLFPIDDGELVVGGIRLSKLAAKIGRTPFYAYDADLVRRRMAELRAALPSTIRIHYAVKANPFPPLLKLMADLADGMDVASQGELEHALATGVEPRCISFAGPGKRREELEMAVANGVLLNVESFREAAELADISQRTGKAARVAVRVNPDFELKSSGMKMGGGPKPFGIDAEQVPALLQQVKEDGLDFQGFHIFAGSQNLDGSAIAEAQRRSWALALRLAESAPAPVRTLNIGGGFGIPYFPGEKRLDLAPIADALASITEALARQMPGAELILELGRYLVGEAGIYVTRIVDRKVSRGQVFLITDGGLNHHLAATGNFGQVLRKNYPLAIGSRMTESLADAPCTVVGPLCTPLDILGQGIVLPETEPGDLVVIFQSGAYGASASPQAFLGHPSVAEILLTEHLTANTATSDSQTVTYPQG